MAKCKRCGKFSFFKLSDEGLCSNCKSLLQYESDLNELQKKISESTAKLSSLNESISKSEEVFNKISSEAEADGFQRAQVRIQTELSELQSKKEALEAELSTLREAIAAAQNDEEKATKKNASLLRKIENNRNLINAIDSAISQFSYQNISEMSSVGELVSQINDALSPTVVLDLQCLSMKELRKRYKKNEKDIAATLDKYKDRYHTKANITIYQLMVLALQSELQNILYTLKYGNLDNALLAIDSMTDKYMQISTEGNQNIAPTVAKFIGEINYLFKEAIRIEYEYYVQKERAKEEQRAIREQMRQEAEERKALEAEKKKIEREESKFHSQIEQLENQMQNTSDGAQLQQLQQRLTELEEQLKSVRDKKDEIATLQNGKAGNVYVISNLGSFGDDVFKIGMTRRLEPQERIDELGSASVPFPFDVHSFIFSDDAVALENKLHKILNERRLNKVNLRKEFFRIPLDDLESLIGEIAPTAEFHRTMLAEQYRQSLSIDHVVDAQEYSTDADSVDDD